MCDSNRGRESRRAKQLWELPGVRSGACDISGCGGSLGRSEAVWVVPEVGLPGSQVLTQESHVPPNDLHVRLTIASGKAGMGVY